MIKLIVGNKGSGKTKTLIRMVNETAASSNGNVVCVEKGLQLTYDISHKVRLVDIGEYKIQGFDCLYGFLGGLMAGNYDITDVFVDATLKIGGRDMDALAAMMEKAAALAGDHKVNLIFTISADASELPESLKQYMI